MDGPSEGETLTIGLPEGPPLGDEVDLKFWGRLGPSEGE